MGIRTGTRVRLHMGGLRVRASHPLRGLWWLACGTCALVWGYAVWRLAVRPDDCGPLEASVAASGWGLSVVPVHVTERRPVRGFARRLATRRGRHADGERDGNGTGAQPGGSA